MTTIPQSPFLSAEQHPLSADTVAALSQPPDAAAELLPDPPSNEGRHQGASTADDWNPEPVDATDCIGEIFHFARKLCDKDHRFVLDEERFLADIEPPPLFLQRAV